MSHTPPHPRTPTLELTLSFELISPRKRNHSTTEVNTPSQLDFLLTPETTRKAKKFHTPRRKDLIDSKMFSFGMFLPTPLSVGSGRSGNMKSPVKSKPKPILESLRAASDDNFVSSTEIDAPVTPKKNIISEPLAKQWLDKSLKPIYTDVEDEEEIARVLSLKKRDYYKDILPNPFIESKSSLNPFIDNEPQISESNLFYSLRQPETAFLKPFGISLEPIKPIDYSTSAEFINQKTGEKFVRKLTESERKIKPKRLDFGIPNQDLSTSSFNVPGSSTSSTNLPGTTPRAKPVSTTSPFTSRPPVTPTPKRHIKVDNNIQNKIDTNTKKFMIKNLNQFMVEGKLKNNLGFEIFNDSDKD